MPSIRPHLPFPGLRRRRPAPPAPSAAPPDPAPPVSLPMVGALPPAPAVSWVAPAPAADLREELVMLESERALAGLHGLDRTGAYADDLRAELDAVRAAYVGTAVVEIAVLRAQLAGRPQG